MKNHFSLYSIHVFKILTLGLWLLSCNQASSSQKTTAPPLSVVVARVVKSDSGRELHLSGTLSAERSIALSFATIGIVEQVMVQEGQAVKKGQVLAAISKRGFQDAVGIAKAKAKQAEDAYRRLAPMHENKTLPDVKMVEVETGLEQARLAVSMARKNLQDAVLRAPVSAVVASRQVEPGASASPAIPAFTLVQTGTLMATAPVPETLIANVQRDAPATVTVPAIQKTFSGIIREIGVIANPLTRTYDVKVALPNPSGELRIGMIADIYLKIDTGEVNFVVPPESVRVDEKGDPYVYLVADNKKLQRRKVAVIRFVGETTAISGNVREGDLIVTSGTPMLADGLAVRVVAQPKKAVPR